MLLSFGLEVKESKPGGSFKRAGTRISTDMGGHVQPVSIPRLAVGWLTFVRGWGGARAQHKLVNLAGRGLSVRLSVNWSMLGGACRGGKHLRIPSWYQQTTSEEGA